MESDYVLKMENISKSYDDNQVLSDISISLKPGEIQALMGENGAGKSTIMNILFGMPVIHSTGGFEGTISIDGNPVDILSPQDAMQLGIGMVHQEFMLIPGFTIAENIKIGREITKPNIPSIIFSKSLETIDMTKTNLEARAALDTIGLNISEKEKVEGLPVGHMQFIEIAREIDKKNMKILVFDEPTAVLTESEASRLLDAMRVIAAKGIAIIFITHRLDEVMNIADSMTVLRDGKFIAHKQIADTSDVEIAELMIGRKSDNIVIDERVDNRNLSYNNIALSLKDFKVEMPGERVQGINLDVRKGEILGIGGLAGQGKIGIPNGIMGLYPTNGEAVLFDEPLHLGVLGDSLKRRIAFVSEDRRKMGLLLDESISHNIAFKAIQVQNKFLKSLGPIKIVDKAKMSAYAKEMVNTFDIRCVSTNQPVGSLSGGNQQKVCLASAITLEPDLLIVSEPTRGIDIGAKKLVLEYLEELNTEKGITIIIVSSELLELRSICDRIVLVAEGKISAILPPNAKDVDFGLAMSGTKIKGGDYN